MKRKTTKTEKPRMPLEEQVANVLHVARRLRGRYVVQKQELGQWKQSVHCNPLMSDGGIQPPGPPLYGPYLWASASEAQQHAIRWRERFATGDPDYYSVVGKDGTWFVAQRLCDAPHPFGSGYPTEAEAREKCELYQRDRTEITLRVVPVEEDLLLTRVHRATPEEEMEFGPRPKMWQVLKKRPALAGAASPSNDAHLAPNWVANLPDDEPVDVALNTRGDGISEDCFSTTAGELYAAGFGELHFERSASGVTVFVDARSEFMRVGKAVAA